MALRKTLAKICSQIRTIPTVCQAITPSAAVLRSRRILSQRLHRRPFFEAAVPPDHWFLTGDRLIERIRALNRDRIRLDAISPPPPEKLSVEDVKKVIRASQMAAVRERLRTIPMNSISYDEFLEICCEESENQGMVIARALDDSGDVIVFGAVVFLRPDLVVKAVESSISSMKTPTRKREEEEEEEELREMEEKKREIDEEAGRKAKRELWYGLGLMAAQTAGFMRLTFWELSWDVMEPICFFFTSFSFMAGYAFFLRTSKDPSFEGLFASRFAVKQRRLMRARGFDLRRFNELRVAARAPELCECRKRRGFFGAGGSSPVNY